MTSFRHPIAAAAILSIAATASIAHDYRVGDVSIDHPYTHATPPGGQTAAAYARLTNNGGRDVRLLRAETAAAERAEIHESSVENGVARMRQVEDGVVIPAGGGVEFAPRSYHVMLFGLKQPFKEGDRVGLTLTFEPGGEIEVELAVHAMAASHHGHP